jgi:hypothetical protein
MEMFTYLISLRFRTFLIRLGLVVVVVTVIVTTVVVVVVVGSGSKQLVGAALFEKPEVPDLGKNSALFMIPELHYRLHKIPNDTLSSANLVHFTLHKIPNYNLS